MNQHVVVELEWSEVWQAGFVALQRVMHVLEKQATVDIRCRQ